MPWGHVAQHISQHRSVPTSQMPLEVVPDSEEERLCATRKQQSLTQEVIEISDDDSDVDTSKKNSKHREIIEISDDDSDSDGGCTMVTASPKKRSAALPHLPPRKAYTTFRKIIHSSDDDDAVAESEAEKCSSAGTNVPKLAFPASESNLSSGGYQLGMYGAGVDEAVIFFEGTRTTKKPIPLSRVTTKRIGSPSKQYTPLEITGSIPKLGSEPKTGSKGRQKQPTKKQEQELKRVRLLAFAQGLFRELNQSAFKGGLPDDTPLVWNVRLTSTAGRAKFHRSRDGKETTEIELSTKVLDSEERIRNTLSHEMCHLAVWVIDKRLDEQHGPNFKKWSDVVMRKRPDIEISTKHEYDIVFPYQWKCEKCSFIYGRFSRSIKPQDCVCGCCKEGTLVPQFTTRPRKNDVGTPKISKLAANKPRDSPKGTGVARLEVTLDDEVDIIQSLTKTLAKTQITLD